MRGYDKNQGRKELLSSLGRALARRAKSCCELCGTAGRPLMPYEVPPVADEPDIDRTVFVCSRCGAGAEDKKLAGDEWRFLENAVWAELAPVQVVAVRMLRRLAEDHRPWAVETADALYLDPEVEEWVDAAH
jgi:protein PhnA